MEGGRLVDFFVESKDARQLVGNIYKGKVTAVVPGIGAAFVDVGLEKNGFLYVMDVTGALEELDDELVSEKEPAHRGKFQSIEEKLKVNDTVMVQVVKEPFGKKGVRLTTHISLPGKHLVLMPGEHRVGISRRIDDKADRARIRSILEKLKIPEGIGLIVRTAGEKAELREFERDLRYLIKLWTRISQSSPKLPTPYLIHEERDLVIRMLRDVFVDDVECAYIDSREEFKKALRFMDYFSSDLKRKLIYYREEIPLFEKMGVEAEIEKLYKRQVNLKSGGYIIIEQTESLVSVDVNTGKFIGHPGKLRKSLEETAFVVNKESAVEIARQIRLRNLGGIIVIDFIDLDSKDYQRKVLNIFHEALKEDKAKIKFYPFSDLGLVEMTRERRRRSIESMFYGQCPYCQGRGHVKSSATLANEALRKLKHHLNKNKSRKITLLVHQELYDKLVKEYWRFIKEIEKRYHARIEIKSAPHLHIEEIKLQ